MELPKREDFSEYENVFRISESVMGFLPNSMLYMSLKPDLLFCFMMLSKTILKQKIKMDLFSKIKIFFSLVKFLIVREREQDSLGMDLRWLVAYVASNAAGCEYCKQHTSHSGRKFGVSGEKFREAFAFYQSEYFSKKEKAALSVALSAAIVPNSVTREQFSELKKYFSKQEIIEIVSVISLFGFLNRWNSTLKTPLEDLFREKT